MRQDHDPGWVGWLVFAGRTGGSWILHQRFSRGEIDAEEGRPRLNTVTQASR